MRLERLDAGGEGDLIVFYHRPGLGLLRVLTAAALACAVASFWDFEMIFLAGALGGSALLSWPIVRWMGWHESTIAVTSTTIRHVKERDPKNTLATIDIHPDEPVVAKTGLVLQRDNGGTTKFRNVEHADQIIVGGLMSMYEAKQMAKTLTEVITSNSATSAQQDLED